MFAPKQAHGTQALKHSSAQTGKPLVLQPCPPFPFPRAQIANIQPQLSPALAFLGPCEQDQRAGQYGSAYPKGSLARALGGSAPGSHHSPLQIWEGNQGPYHHRLCHSPSPLQDPAALLQLVCAVKDLESCPAHKLMKPLLTDYPAAGISSRKATQCRWSQEAKHLGARGVRNCQRGRTSEWANGDGEETEDRGREVGEGPEFLISNWYLGSLHPSGKHFPSWSLRLPSCLTRQLASLYLRALVKGRVVLLRGTSSLLRISSPCLVPNPKLSGEEQQNSSLVSKSHLPREKGSRWIGDAPTPQHHPDTSLQPPGSCRAAKLPYPSWYFESGGSYATPAKAGFMISILGEGKKKG